MHVTCVADHCDIHVTASCDRPIHPNLFTNYCSYCTMQLLHAAPAELTTASMCLPVWHVRTMSGLMMSAVPSDALVKAAGPSM